MFEPAPRRTTPRSANSTWMPIVSGTAASRPKCCCYADDFVIGFEGAADARQNAGGPQRTSGQVRPVVARGQNEPHRVRTPTGPGSTTALRAASGDLRFFSQETEQRLTRKLKDLRQKAWRHMQAPVAEQHQWYSCIPRGHYSCCGCLPQLPGAERTPPGGSTHLAAVPPATKPEG